jgi:hypothetical protein
MLAVQAYSRAVTASIPEPLVKLYGTVVRIKVHNEKPVIWAVLIGIQDDACASGIH